MNLENANLIGQGNTAQVYRIEDNHILKLFRTGLDESIITREYENGKIIQCILENVPKVIDIVRVEGRMGIIYEEIIGKDMLKAIMSSIWKLNYYAKQLAHYHSLIQIPVDEVMPSVKEKLSVDIEHADSLTTQQKKAILDYLEQLPGGDTLCHFDLHPGNIMLRNNEPVILDWMTGCRGDGCADIARTSLMLNYGQVPHAPWLIRKMISLFQKHIYKIYIKEYLKLTHTNPEDISKWQLPVAATRLREWIPKEEKQILLAIVNREINQMTQQ